MPVVSEFINFIENPLDWRIANETIKIDHHEIKIDNLILKIPITKDFDLI
jgi:hypothetical protein